MPLILIRFPRPVIHLPAAGFYFPLIIPVFFLLFFSVSAQTLEDYQRIAVKNDPGLNSKYKAYEMAMAQVAQAGSLPDPVLSLGYFISPVETRVGSQRAKLSLTQMLPWFGTLKAAGDVAALRADAQYQVFLEARNKHCYQVAAAYYALYEVERQIALDRENVEILESYKTIATARFEHGEGTLVDVLRADIMIKGAETNLEILQQKKVPLRTTFNKLLDRDERAEVVVADSLFVITFSVDRDSLLAGHPTLNELAIRQEAGREQERLVQKQSLPRLGVGLDYVMVSERSDMSVPNNGRNALMPMVSVGLPVFSGKYKAAEKEAQLAQEGYVLQTQERMNRLVSEFELADFDRKQQLSLLKLYDEQIAGTQQILRLLLSAYGNSGEAFEEVLQTHQQLLNYRKRKTMAMANYYTAVARLRYF